MSEQLAAPVSTTALKARGYRDPLLGTRRLSRRQIMLAVRLRLDLVDPEKRETVAAARAAVGEPLWPALSALIDFRRDGAMEMRRAGGAWAKIRVALDLLGQHYAAVDAAGPQAKQVEPKPKLVTTKLRPNLDSAPPPARAPFRLGQSAGV